MCKLEAKIADTVAALNDDRNPLFPDPKKVAPISVGVLKSGEWHSTVPDLLVAEGRYGVFPDESVESAKEQFTTMIQTAAEQDD